MGAVQQQIKSTRERLARQPLEQLFAQLQRFVQLDDGLVSRRVRIWPMWRVFWLFLLQTLTAGMACREVLLLAQANSDGLDPFSLVSGAYCRARARLAESALLRTLRENGARLTTQVPVPKAWHGRRVKVVDGSSAQMPDTPENQKEYPQPSRQKKGCGQPVMRFVALFDLASGMLLACETGALKPGERALWRTLWETALVAGDIVLGDRGFCSLCEFWVLLRRGVDSVVRLNQRRSKGTRRKKKLGKGDELVWWIKSKQRPQWLALELWREVPKEFLVRHITFQLVQPGFRTKEVTLATTLLDHRKWPAAVLADLYRQRWRAELHLRDLKTTMGMEMLRCKSPAMARKELTMHLIGYNLVRALMSEAAARSEQVDLAWISFKGALTALRQFASPLAQCSKRRSKLLWELLLFSIAEMLVPERPGRQEPRAIKRRPKNYAWLTQPRHEYKEIHHRSKYSAKAKEHAHAA